MIVAAVGDPDRFFVADVAAGEDGADGFPEGL